MKRFGQFFSFFLLLIFLFTVSPKEFLHELFHQHEHESTDLVCPTGCGDHISVQHEHCEILQLTNPPIYTPMQSSSPGGLELLWIQLPLLAGTYHFSSSPFLFFRGPPELG